MNSPIIIAADRAERTVTLKFDCPIDGIIMGQPYKDTLLYGEKQATADIQKLIQSLQSFNQWRRGDETIEQPDPVEIGKVIDATINLLSKYESSLQEIRVFAHCVAKAGPLNTPTLQDAWSKFMEISAMASKGLSKQKSGGSGWKS